MAHKDTLPQISVISCVGIMYTMELCFNGGFIWLSKLGVLSGTEQNKLIFA